MRPATRWACGPWSACSLTADSVSDSPSTRELSRVFARESAKYPRLRWKLQGLRAGASAYVLARLLKETEQPVLIVTATVAAAELLATELAAMYAESFESAFGERRVHLLPAREAPPLEMISAPAEVEAARTAALYQLAFGQAPIVVASVDSLASTTVAPEQLRQRVLLLGKGQELEFEELASQLTGLGYRAVGKVEDAGEIATRGGIFDLWPPGFEFPCRVELDGDEIASLRLFDPVDQRSFTVVDEIVVLPSLPFELADLADRRVRERVAERADELLIPSAEQRNLEDCLLGGEHFPGVELLAPYVDADRSSERGSHGPFWAVDFLPEGGLRVVVDAPAVEEAIGRVADSLVEAQEAVEAAGGFFLPPELLYVDTKRLRALVAARPLLEVDYAEAFESGGKAGDRVWRLDVHGNTAIAAARARVKARRGESGFGPVVEAINAAREAGHRVVMACSDATQLGRIAHLLELCETGPVGRADSFSAACQVADSNEIQLVEVVLHEGFLMPADHLAVVTDEELFGRRRHSRRRRTSSRSRNLSVLSELEAGDYLVHIDHGVGLYQGLKHMKAAGTEGDFLHIEFAGGDRYYLPVDRISLVEKFVGAGSTAPVLDKLGSSVWVRTKSKARDSILEMARELLDIEAHRASAERPPLPGQGPDFEEFEARFPFEETEGQLSAIADVAADLTGHKPMDRVVCGDVGYGKTEVAIRAAYLAAMGGRQTAFLVPTTVLARQHYESLVERFNGYPIEIAMLSRFQSNAANTAIVARLKAGQVDIVVGTHRLLQKDVRFANLGLLVIDEEHRFGVKAKEQLKTFRREVDVLTLTATPIPRTLQLALTGVRDLSLIETPPADRLAIRTYIARYDEGTIKQALTRELGRGGQAFFLHNRVSTIESMARRLRELVPGIRVGVGHGQMGEGALEKVMMDFLQHDLDVLVCSTIIESGLDIPNANTILVNRADTFGLAQLYQIRGRVGRSHRRAYAYLLIPGQRIISEGARKRLAVLQQLDDLGAGFRLAAHDMEIRGAGNLLGRQQSGQIAAVGFELFMRMMEEATAELKGAPLPPHIEPDVDMGTHAFLPGDYVRDVAERLTLYRRLANAKEIAGVEEVAEEMADRFGPLPEPARRFVAVMRLRPLLRRLAVESLKASGNVVLVRFAPESHCDPQVGIELMQLSPRKYRLKPDGALTMFGTDSGWWQLVNEVEQLLGVLVTRSGLGDSA